MNTAQVAQWGQAPKYVKVDAPAAPAPESDTVQLKVKAASLHALVRSRASGNHYTATTLPHVPGVDGVGTTPDGKHVYFSTLMSGGGSFSDIVNVPKRATSQIPEGVDPVQVAAFMNPGLSSWLAFKTRVDNLPAGFSVLIVGATSASGRLAIPLARALGASKVVGAARNAEALAALELDETVVIKDKVTDTDFSAVEVDVVLDYVYGPVAEHLLNTIKTPRHVQYVHIGSLSGQEISLPSAVLRSKNITIRGSGMGAWTPMDMGRHIPSLIQAFTILKPFPVNVAPLSEVETKWAEKSETRTVFIP